jgi:2-dehydropantoate 2-reductase
MLRLPGLCPSFWAIVEAFTMPGLKYGIVGVGPSGGILAAFLAANREDVAVADVLKSHAGAIRKNGLKLTGMKNMTVKLNHVFDSIADLASYDPDVIFICTKTTVLAPVVKDVRAIHRPGRKVVCYQNGIENECVISDAVGEEDTIRVVINHAGTFPGDGVINMTFFHKPNYIGAVSKKSADFAARLAKSMTDAGLDTELVPDIKMYEWQKSILNAALAPLTAVTGQTMSEALALPETEELAEQLLREGIAVAKALGYDYGDGFFDSAMEYWHSAGNHKPSMRFDVEAGKRTEIDVITGKIVEHGKRLGVPVAANMALYAAVKGLESLAQKKR